MKTPALIDLALDTVRLSFTGKIRIGSPSTPTATHSIRVGLSLLAYGYTVDTGIGGLFHDVKEDTDFSEDFVLRLFGSRVHFLMLACTLDPHLEEKGPGEDELYARVVGYAEKGDLDPIRIKCADSLDNLRTNRCLRPEDQRHALEKGRRWHAAALRFFPDEALAEDFGLVIQRESRLIEARFP